MFRLITLLVVLALCFFSCECEEIPIIEPETVDPFLVEIDNESNEFIILRFNKFIDSTSFVYNTSFFVENNGQPVGVEYSIQSQATYDEVIILKCGGVDCSTAICDLTFKLLGDGAEGIKSKDGQSLDGNRDGTDGGDLEEAITITACITPQSNPLLISGVDTANNSIVISFSEHLDQTSVVLGSSFLLSGNSAFTVSGFSIEMQSGFDQIVVPFCFIECGSSDICGVAIQLLGDGPNTIKSSAGRVLDGDGDGTDGGDYATEINIPSCQDPFVVTNLTTDTDNLIISFSKHLDPSSVSLAGSMVINGNDFIGVGAYSIQAQTDFDNILIPLCGIDCGTVNPCDISVDLLGDGSNVIRSIDGQVLDGDMDSNEGGNFSQDITVNTCYTMPFVVNDLTTDNENLIISFSDHLDVASVALGGSMIINGNDLVGIGAFSIQTQSGFDNILIPLCQIDCGNINLCDISVELLGNGSNVIRNVDGQILDGDMDGNEGGNFSQNITVNTCYFPFLVEDVFVDDEFINIVFNQPVDPGSVVLGASVDVVPINNSFTNNPFDFEVQNEVLKLPLCDFQCGNDPICEVNLFLYGTGVAGPPLSSIDGLPLEDGGTYQTTLTLDICTDPNSFRINDPPPNGGIGFNGWDPGFNTVWTIFFNEPVDVSTVINGETFLENSSFSPSTIWWNSNNTELTIDMVFFPEEGKEFKFVGIDQGEGVIRNNQGEILDGDWNGLPGGDHSIYFFYNQIPIVNIPFNLGSNDSIMWLLDPIDSLLYYDLEFNAPMDTSSFILDQSIFLTHNNFGSTMNVPFELVWDENSNLTRCRIVLDNQVDTLLPDVCESGTSCSFNLLLKGDDDTFNPPVLIRHAYNGLGFDGNYSYNPGGDYEIKFYYPY